MHVYFDNQCSRHVPKDHNPIKDSAVQQAGAHTFSTEQFDRMSNWYPMAILQLMRMKDSPRKNKSKFVIWAAKKLGVNHDLVESTINSLLEMELVIEKGGVLSPAHDTVWTTHQVPSGAIRMFHRQMIEKAKTAIEMQSIEERFLHSIQMPVLKTDLQEIQNEIVKFRNQLLRKYGRTTSEDADTVYGLNLQLFKLLED